MRAILLISILLWLAAYLVTPIVDPDVWWHIVSGRWIVTHVSVPHTDLWTRFGEGLPWRAYSWSSEVILALTDRYFGIHGLLVLKLLLACAIVASLAIVFSKLSQSIFTGMVLTIFCAFACCSHFTLRPQSFTWILFCFVLLAATRIEQRGASATRLTYLLLCFCLWANTHLSAVLALFALGSWLLPSTSKHSRTLYLALAAAFAGTIITPYCGGEWLTLFETSSHPMLFSRIAEFKPANILQFNTGFLILSLALLAWVLCDTPRTFSWGKLLGAAIFTTLGLAIIKFMPLAIIYNCALVATALSRKTPFRLSEALALLDRTIARLPAQGLSFVFLCLAFVSFYGVWQNPLSNRVPVRTLDFIIKNQLPQPLLNTFNHGGYISYRYASREGDAGTKVSIDGRTNLIPSEMWEHYSAAMYGGERWQVLLQRVQPNTIIWSATSPLIALLKQSSEWCEVFREGYGENGTITFVRRGSFAACT